MVNAAPGVLNAAPWVVDAAAAVGVCTLTFPAFTKGGTPAGLVPPMGAKAGVVACAAVCALLATKTDAPVLALCT